MIDDDSSFIRSDVGRCSAARPDASIMDCILRTVQRYLYVRIADVRYLVERGFDRRLFDGGEAFIPFAMSASTPVLSIFLLPLLACFSRSSGCACLVTILSEIISATIVVISTRICYILSVADATDATDAVKVVSFERLEAWPRMPLLLPPPQWEGFPSTIRQIPQEYCQ
jgi:hypothetical protein